MKWCGHDTVRLSRRVREWTHRTFSRKRPTSVGNVSKVRMIVILPFTVNLEFPIQVQQVPIVLHRLASKFCIAEHGCVRRTSNRQTKDHVMPAEPQTGTMS